MERNVSFFLFLICTLIFCRSSTTTTSASSTPCLDSKCPMFANADVDVDFQELKGEIEQRMMFEDKTEVSSLGLGLGLFRRLLRGPGSEPPKCYSKCGKCRPCIAAVQWLENGEARWMCKCGGKYYDPS